MKADNPIKHFALAFCLALVCYLVFYNWIEHRRTRKGPWQMSFTNDAAGTPRMIINQPALGLTNIELVFPGQIITNRNVLGTLSFAQPRPVPHEVGFATCVFMDTTFLPGTLTFRVFGHEVEFLPRTMIIDHEERAWTSGRTIELPAAGVAGPRDEGRRPSQ